MVTEIIEKPIKTKRIVNIWTKEEEEIVKLYYKNNKQSLEFIRDLINQRFNKLRSLESIRHRVTDLKLTKLPNDMFWTEPENIIVQTYFNSTHKNSILIQEKIKKECGKDRTIVSICARAHILGFTSRQRNIWTVSQIKQLNNLVGKYSAKEISTMINMPVNSIRKKCLTLKYKLGFSYRTDWYTLLDLCKIFGVSSKKIKQWMQEKIIVYDEFQKGVYRFSESNLKEFICKYPLEFNSKNIDMVTFINILCPDPLLVKKEK